MPSSSTPRFVDFDLGEAPGHLLRRCHQRSHDIFLREVGASGVTRQQAALLIAASQNPGASQQQLSDATGCDRNTLADVISRLQKQGLAERRRSSRDSRATEVFVTPKGEAVLEAILPALARVQAEILAPLPPELRPVFIRCAKLMAGLPDPG